MREKGRHDNNDEGCRRDVAGPLGSFGNECVKGQGVAGDCRAYGHGRPTEELVIETAEERQRVLVEENIRLAAKVSSQESSCKLASNAHRTAEREVGELKSELQVALMEKEAANVGLRTAVTAREVAENQRNDQCSLFETELRAASSAADKARRGEEAAHENLRERVASGNVDSIPRKVVKEEMEFRTAVFNMTFETEMRSHEENEERVRATTQKAKLEMSELRVEKDGSKSENGVLMSQLRKVQSEVEKRLCEEQPPNAAMVEKLTELKKQLGAARSEIEVVRAQGEQTAEDLEYDWQDRVHQIMNAESLSDPFTRYAALCNEVNVDGMSHRHG